MNKHEKMSPDEIDAMVNPKPKSEAEEMKRRPGEGLWDWLDRMTQKKADADTDRRRAERNGTNFGL